MINDVPKHLILFLLTHLINLPIVIEVQAHVVHVDRHFLIEESVLHIASHLAEWSQEFSRTETILLESGLNRL